MVKYSAFFLTFLLFLCSPPLHAAPSDLDATFGTNGTVVMSSLGSVGVTSLALQPDGKILIGGFVGQSGNNNFAVVRFNANGSLDTSFRQSPNPNQNPNGMVSIDFGGTEQSPRIAVQVDGKILMAGISINNASNGSSIAVARLNSDGNLDSSFDGDGMQQVSINTWDTPYALAIQSDGKVVIAGDTRGVNGGDFVLVRLLTNGSRDASFGTNGVVVTDAGGSDSLRSVVTQSDGAIVAVGSSLPNGGGNIRAALARYHGNGALDTNFGGTGVLLTSVSPISYLLSVKVQSDGKIVALGGGSTGTNSDLILARYMINGTLDPSFNQGRWVTTDFAGDFESPVSLGLQSDGKILVGGSSVNASRSDFAVYRYTSQGELDTTFNGTGRVMTDFGGPDTAYGMVLQPDGKIVMAGTTTSQGALNIAMARYLGEFVPGSGGTGGVGGGAGGNAGSGGRGGSGGTAGGGVSGMSGSGGTSGSSGFAGGIAGSAGGAGGQAGAGGISGTSGSAGGGAGIGGSSGASGGGGSGEITGDPLTPSESPNDAGGCSCILTPR